MRTKWTMLASVCVMLFVAGCGVNGTIVYNVNSAQTVVELGEANFEIVYCLSGMLEVA